jgi:peptide/nickel transport system permease protein
MTTYIIRRLIQMIPVVILVSMISFSLTFVLPGDPALAILGEELARDKKLYQQTREELGLDRPILIQYLSWSGKVVRGDFGNSTRTRLPVSKLMLQRMEPTLQLATFAMLFALALAIPVGLISAVKPGSKADIAGTMVAMLGVCIPHFWLGLLLILTFGLWLGWLPPSGFVPFLKDPVMNLKLMILPTITLGGGIAAVVMRQTRSAMLEVLRQDYITTARSKGLRGKVVVMRHALKNALIPVSTVVGLQMGLLMGGSVITETIFGIPGVGRLAADSLFARDFPVLQAVVLLMAGAVLVANLLTDIGYGWLDPRIRYS